MPKVLSAHGLDYPTQSKLRVFRKISPSISLGRCAPSRYNYGDGAARRNEQIDARKSPLVRITDGRRSPTASGSFAAIGSPNAPIVFRIPAIPDYNDLIGGSGD